ncbi:MAG: MraY family glycosyltransferase [Thermodesulfobacteriota bacterium]
MAITLRVLDHPNERKIHSSPIPLLGSIAVYMGVLSGLLSTGINPFVAEEFRTIFFCATLLLIVGLFDDAGFLHPQIKLLVAMPIAGLILIFFDLGLKIFPLNLLNPFFTLLWVVGITAAYNLLDGMDGLSTGVCVIASLFYLLIGTAIGDHLLLILSLSLMGGCLGFLIFNFHPAKIFLGDSGAILLGFFLAAMGLRVANMDSLPILTRWMLPVLILSVPIFDTSLITFSRLKRGLIPFLHPGKDHSHHRILNLGLGQRKTVLLIYLFGIAGGLVSLIIYRLPIFGAYLLFSLLLLSCTALLFFFEKLPYERQ